jgi:hypothetical protein
MYPILLEHKSQVLSDEFRTRNSTLARRRPRAHRYSSGLKDRNQDRNHRQERIVERQRHQPLQSVRDFP